MTDRTHHLLPGHEVLSRNGPKIGAKWIRDPVISEYDGDRIVITTAPEPPPPPPPPPPVTGRTFYLAPNGSDSASGALSAPWRTILFASSKLLPGDTLLVRGGTYTGQGGYNWKSSGQPGKPVTIRSFAVTEPAMFDGTNQSHGIIVSGHHDVVIGGLRFTKYGMGPSGDGAILLLNAGGIVIEDGGFYQNGTGFQQDHHIYVNSGCRDITIRRNYFRGTPGAAVHIYHDPGPLNVVIEDNEMHDGYWGVVVGSNANGVKIDRNVFSGNTRDVDNQRGTNVTRDGVAI